jgi:wyosine [tRNA(Phe)-imidazoG37] synthetase (radical SAM superfamily)
MMNQPETKYRYVFGPVSSRRFGRSLGVDLIPFKTCTYDCIYCQLGRTSNKTLQRKSYVPAREVLEEIRQKLQEGAQPDYITFSGSGEPTLNADLGFLIREVKKLSNVPVLVLTNGSLLSIPEVRQELKAADIVSPSLDAGDEAMFLRIDRPHGGIVFEEMVDGLATFRESFSGRVWLEVFLVEGLNATGPEVEKIRSHLQKIRPDKVQLNTAVRPTAEKSAKAVPMERMRRFCELLGPGAEVIAAASVEALPREIAATSQMVLDFLQRRPATLQDIASGMGLNANEALKHIVLLKSLGSIKEVMRGEKRFFVAVRG